MMQKPYTIFSTLFLSLLVLATMGICVLKVPYQHPQTLQTFLSFYPVPGPALSTKDSTFHSLGIEPGQKACIGCPDDNHLGFVYGSLESRGH